MVHHKAESSTLLPQKATSGSTPGLKSNLGGNCTSIATCPPLAPNSTTKTYHLILCEQIVKEVIISETEVRTSVPTGLTSPGNFPAQRSFSSGTLPRTSSGSVVVPGIQQQQQQHQIRTTSSASPQSSLLTPEYIKKFQNKKLTKHLAWKDERRAVSHFLQNLLHCTPTASTRTKKTSHFHGFRSFHFKLLLVSHPHPFVSFVARTLLSLKKPY